MYVCMISFFFWECRMQTKCFDQIFLVLIKYFLFWGMCVCMYVLYVCIYEKVESSQSVLIKCFLFKMLWPWYLCMYACIYLFCSEQDPNCQSMFRSNFSHRALHILLCAHIQKSVYTVISFIWFVRVMCLRVC